jgi:hypothetical protein
MELLVEQVLPEQLAKQDNKEIQVYQALPEEQEQPALLE